MDRRQVVTGGALAAAALATGPARAEAHAAAHGFVLVHGAWHGAWTWTDMVPQLMAAGHPTHAVELPGAGTKALYPASYSAMPFDPAAFATEPGATAALTQAERTAYTVEAVRATAAASPSGKVVLMGHSLGGLTISPVVEAVPELIHAVVYLTAFLLRDGDSAGAVLADAAFAEGQVASVLVADPTVVGCLRMNPRSTDPAYLAQARDTFYADVPEERVTAIAAMLHVDEAAALTGTPVSLSAAKYGTVARHYIVMEDDKAIPAAAQDFMIARMDAAGLGAPTTVHRLAGSHSPFFAQPRALTDLLLGIAQG